MTEFLLKWKWLLLALAGIFLVLCFFLLAGLGWTAFRSQTATPTFTREPESFNYCGARLTSLCVVSFGRDAFGDTIINLYVPENAYSPFYLNVIRARGESRYDCVENKKIATSVYCTGSAINLGEGFEIQMIAERNNNLMAQGTFTLTAFLVGTPAVGDAASESASSEPTATGNVVETPTASVFELDPFTATASTPARTPTPSTSSYPSYP